METGNSNQSNRSGLMTFEIQENKIICIFITSLVSLHIRHRFSIWDCKIGCCNLKRSPRNLNEIPVEH